MITARAVALLAAVLTVGAGTALVLTGAADWLRWEFGRGPAAGLALLGLYLVGSLALRCRIVWGR